MSDITKCSGEGCPISDLCYRFNAEPDPLRQSWFAEVPWDEEDESCDYYWEDTNE